MSEPKHIIDKIRVLVVEDEYYLAADLVAALQQQGGEVIGPANDAARARRLINDLRPECAIIDLNLSGALGLDVADALDVAGVPYIILSGYDRSALPLQDNPAPYVSKPADAAAVVRMIPALLAGRMPQAG